jgi:Alginate export
MRRAGDAVGRAKIVSPGIRVERVPAKAADRFVAYRLMWLADRTDAFSTTGVRDPSGRSGSFAEEQLDARSRYWLIQDRLRLELDGVWLAKGRFLREAPNASPRGDTKYLSMNLTTIF